MKLQYIALVSALLLSACATPDVNTQPYFNAESYRLKDVAADAGSYAVRCEDAGYIRSELPHLLGELQHVEDYTAMNTQNTKPDEGVYILLNLTYDLNRRYQSGGTNWQFCRGRLTEISNFSNVLARVVAYNLTQKDLSHDEENIWWWADYDARIQPLRYVRKLAAK